MGSEQVVNLVATGGADERSFTAVFDPGVEVTAGETLAVVIDPDRVHVFDDETGETLTADRDWR